MDTEKTKPILITVAVVCLVGAGVFLYINMGGGTRTGLKDSVPMICLACQHTYQLPAKELQMMNPMAMSLFDCPSCSRKAVQIGMNCSDCNTIFVADFTRNPELKCPKCGKSSL